MSNSLQSRGSRHRIRPERRKPDLGVPPPSMRPHSRVESMATALYLLPNSADFPPPAAASALLPVSAWASSPAFHTARLPEDRTPARSMLAGRLHRRLAKERQGSFSAALFLSRLGR